MEEGLTSFDQTVQNMTCSTIDNMCTYLFELSREETQITKRAESLKVMTFLQTEGRSLQRVMTLAITLVVAGDIFKSFTTVFFRGLPVVVVHFQTTASADTT